MSFFRRKRKEYLIGRDAAWIEIIGMIFRVLDFDRNGTTIDENGNVIAKSDFKPYGYLTVETPIIPIVSDTPLLLPIVHRDDFLLASSVYDYPDVFESINNFDLLVTYIPKEKLPGGAIGITHGLHYVVTNKNVLEEYYEVDNGIHKQEPAPEKLFKNIAWDGELKVEFNL